MLPLVDEAAAYKYQFDDVYGPSGIGGQWVITTRSYDYYDQIYEWHTRGEKAATPIEVIGNIVKSRDHVYSINGKAEIIPTPVPTEPINYIFMVIPETQVSNFVDFTWVSKDLTPGETYTNDVRIGDIGYRAIKEGLAKPDPYTSSFRFDLTKTTDASAYNTLRTYMVFHQNPTVTPSQTLNIPFVIANVANGTAAANPLDIKTLIRSTTGTGRMGDIVAYDHFTWDVTRDKDFGGDNDWIFVPLPDDQINSHNNIRYPLYVDVRNFCGIRYELQRYDDKGVNATRVFPTQWAMDLPADVDDVTPRLYLHQLSHIAPGMITSYEQRYNPVTSAQKIFAMYGVDNDRDSTTPRNLLLKHSTIYGVDLGAASGSGYYVQGFSYLPSNTNFLIDAACDLSAPELKMPQKTDEVVYGHVGSGFVTADAASTFEVDSPIPAYMQYVSSDVIGLLPLHVTFNLPKSDQYVVGKWQSYLNEWKRTGDIMDSFYSSFRIHMHAADGTDQDLSKWMKDNGVYASNVKVFMDESKDCITVSFIVMLVDSKKTTISLLSDKTTNVDRKYLTIRDGNRNDRWDMKFYVSHIQTSPDPTPTPSGGGGGGGGCASGMSALCLLIALPFVFKRKDGDEK